MKAIRVHQTGGPEVLRWEDGSVGEPGTGEARVRHTAVGLNYVDVYYRTGLYKAPSLPFTPGSEAAGVVEAVGAGVTDIKAGVRVVYDSVGKDTLLGSLDCLQTLGMVALFGQSSGPVPSFDPALLARGSFFITRPSLFHYVAAREDLLSAARALFDVVLSGAVKVEVRQTYPLAEAA